VGRAIRSQKVNLLSQIKKEEGKYNARKGRWSKSVTIATARRLGVAVARKAPGVKDS